MKPSLPGLIDTIWLVPAVLLWATGIVLASVSYVRLRFPAQRPATSGGPSLTPSLIVLMAGIGFLLAVKWYFGLAGMVLGIACLGLGALATLVAGTLSTARDYKAMMRDYDSCIQKGMSWHEVLSEVSRLRHPELSSEVHDVLSHKLAVIYRLFFFYDTGVEPGRRKPLRDSDVLSTLYSSEMRHVRGDVYRAQVDFEKEASLRERLSKAEALCEAGDSCQGDAGLAKYDEAIAVAPEYIVAHVHRGHRLSAVGRYEDAIRGYDDALRLCPDLPVAWQAKGDCHTAQNRFAEAVLHFARAVELHPVDGRLRIRHARVQALASDYEGALSTLASECCLQDPEAWLVKGDALLRLQRGREALNCLARATAMAPENPKVWKEMGFAQMIVGQFKEAEGTIDNAIRLSPADAEAWELKGNLHELRANAASVHQATYRMTRAFGVDVPANMNPPAPEVTIDHLRSAERFYLKAVELDPECRTAVESLEGVRRELTRYGG
jgi:tetratricopeptide (TPR) repeat protein